MVKIVYYQSRYITRNCYGRSCIFCNHVSTIINLACVIAKKRGVGSTLLIIFGGSKNSWSGWRAFVLQQHLQSWEMADNGGKTQNVSSLWFCWLLIQNFYLISLFIYQTSHLKNVRLITPTPAESFLMREWRQVMKKCGHFKTHIVIAQWVCWFSIWNFYSSLLPLWSSCSKKLGTCVIKTVEETLSIVMRYVKIQEPWQT